MIEDAANLNALWSRLIIEELVRSGIEYFCISPGSRSTPLTLAVAENRWTQTQICYDERAAAFHALGFAKATGQPAALICTSGTAVANYLPAIVEAHQTQIPLIVLSADRPPELRETGANQTIFQPHIFHNYINWQIDFPCPTEAIDPAFVLTSIDQAVYRATRSPKGPVHINCMFREPFGPISEPEMKLPSLEKWQDCGAPFTKYCQPQPSISERDLKFAAQKINNGIAGLLLIGRLETEADAKAAVALARALNWPTVIDPQSGLRTHVSGAPFVLAFDHMLLIDAFKARFKPDVVLQLGDRIISKRVGHFVAQADLDANIVVTNHPFRGDPAHRVSLRIEAPVAVFCTALKNHVIFSQPGQQIFALDRQIVKTLKLHFSKDKKLTEAALAHTLPKLLPERSGLFVGNSMPIRDFDMFAVANYKKPIHFFANRGASGIDGNLATAAGCAAGLQRPVTVVLGDVAAVHDLNSLVHVQQSTEPVIVIVVNNHGGGIFHFLPIAEQTDYFEKFWGTPHDLSFESAADLFNLNYAAPKSKKEFVAAYTQFMASGKSAIIEVITDRDQNVADHRAIQKLILAKCG